MPRDAQMEARLQRWAQWVTVGDGSGYPVKSVLHPEWQPPSPGITPTLKVAPATDVRATHWAIAHLVQRGVMSQRLANTLVVHYCMHLSLSDQAMRLECSIDSIHDRVERAHRMLMRELCNIHELG
jgi:hypothetical protein